MKINQITHSSELVQRKVNYFADYYYYTVNNIGKYDGLEIENHRSLIEKSIYQIENNLEYCPLYLEYYFNHTLLGRDLNYLEAYKHLDSASSLISQFLRAGNRGKKVKWICGNPQFLESLKALNKELRRKMFECSLKEVVSFLKCSHDLNEHAEAMKHHTHIMVSEFLLKGGDRTEASTVIDRIMSNEVGVFPFPNSLLNNNTGDRLQDAKEKFIEHRTFDQQFDGISNIYKQKARKVDFLFRISGVPSEPNFRFKYNKVAFYHSNHAKFNQIKEKFNDSLFPGGFFVGNQLLIAVVRVEYFSTTIAEQQALNTLQSELEFLN